MSQTSETTISENITYKELQEYVWQMNKDRGFADENAESKFILLVEEVGELAKALRSKVGLKFSETTKRTEIKEELADVQILLLGLASTLGFDMYEAVAEKETKNNQRTWK